jgi:hypothetical protein
MAVTANSIITPQTPKAATAEVTTGNTNYDAPTNTAVLATAGANGGRVTRITAIPRETVADTQLQLYRDGDGGGAAKRFFRSAKMASYAMATGTEAPTTDFGYSDDNPVILAPGEKLYCATAISKKITFNAEWADY